MHDFDVLQVRVTADSLLYTYLKSDVSGASDKFGTLFSSRGQRLVS